MMGLLKEILHKSFPNLHLGEVKTWRASHIHGLQGSNCSKPVLVHAEIGDAIRSEYAHATINYLDA
jgi:hypothetical protein